MMDKEVPTSGFGDISALEAFVSHFLCGTGLVLAYWIAANLCGWNIISHTWQTLCLIWLVECPFVLIGFSYFQKHRPYMILRAFARGLVALPIGALINAFGAIVLGAPFSLEFFQKTLNWSLLMSLLTFVPAASVYGGSWKEWRHIFANFKPNTRVDYMVCLPAHGAFIGAWFGAWPMPLDWERPWQEWPICVTYGAIAGYIMGSVVSCVCCMRHVKDSPHVKAE